MVDLKYGEPLKSLGFGAAEVEFYGNSHFHAHYRSGNISFLIQDTKDGGIAFVVISELEPKRAFDLFILRNFITAGELDECVDSDVQFAFFVTQLDSIVELLNQRNHVSTKKRFEVFLEQQVKKRYPGMQTKDSA